MLPARRPSLDLAGFVPSGRSVVVGVALFVFAIAAYIGALETSVFGVATIDVRGATPQVREQVREALAPERGSSLLKIDGNELDRRLAAIPGVRSFTYDRSFPHTLRIRLKREWPALVLRRGSDAYLLSTDGRVLQRLVDYRRSRLPRLYVPRDTRIAVGETTAGPILAAGTSLGPLRGAPLPGGVRFVVSNDKNLTFVLGASRFELRLGDSGDLRLKLAIARRILRQTGAVGAGAGYLDVSVPERPVLLTNPKVATTG